MEIVLPLDKPSRLLEEAWVDCVKEFTQRVEGVAVYGEDFASVVRRVNNCSSTQTSLLELAWIPVNGVTHRVNEIRYADDAGYSAVITLLESTQGKEIKLRPRVMSINGKSVIITVDILYL